jgi:pyroglutamyl-peptidase
MQRILITAFGPYGPFDANASQLCLEALASQPWDVQAERRIYPVDFTQARQMLAADLTARYDLAIHLGQSPRARAVQLEAVALNVCGPPELAPEHYGVLETEGPVAYRSRLPLDRLVKGLRAQGIAAEVSYHAGTYLCNAVYYWSYHLAAQLGLRTVPLFVHLPLVHEQRWALPHMPSPAAMPMTAHESARAVRVLCRLLTEAGTLG